MNQIYNFTTWFWHKVLHVPIQLTRVYDNKVKNPKVTAVFLHGISTDSTGWKTTLKQFNNSPELAEVRLVAFDLLGFGKSLRADWLDYDEEEYNKALHRSIQKLGNTNSLIIVGHSMGALIAANYARNFEEALNIKELILVSPPVLMSDEMAKLPDKVYIKSYGSLYKIAHDVPAAEVLAKLVQKFSSFQGGYLKTTAFEKSMENIILNHHNYQTFVSLKVPTLLIHGHFDPLVMRSNLKRVSKRNPRYVKYVSVIGHHDISIGKRVKILLEIKKRLKEESKNHEAL